MAFREPGDELRVLVVGMRADDEHARRRAEAEDQVARFRAVADRFKERITGPADEELQAILAELEALEGRKKAAETVADGVAVLADDLEDRAA